jgi:hypothetical protein
VPRDQQGPCIVHCACLPSTGPRRKPTSAKADARTHEDIAATSNDKPFAN